MNDVIDFTLNPNPGHVRNNERSNQMQHAMHDWIDRAGAAMRTLLMLYLLGLASLLAGCSKEDKVAVEVSGYNHMPDWSISGFSVNGGSGPNLSPESGGGGFSCCVEIPKRWKPGMKAKVSWSYDTDQGGPRPPPPQEAEVEIPEYTPENLGTVQVHFYPNHRIKVVASRYSLGHPKYPLPKEDWAPWTLNEDWARNYQLDQEEQRKK
ncbi:DUF3304 domain-containing protein [Paraherbaspirillum soli]|uniref:DUF3304 domain-containing protein n=1 Tax=Paraherbaspirillum soli TaxID=631222 RepID=A0ABW0M2P5_9BURK